jgi:hypothetical protein
MTYSIVCFSSFHAGLPKGHDMVSVTPDKE